MMPTDRTEWVAGDAPLAVVMISLNEGHNMQAVLDNLKGFAAEVFLVDSYSSDDTVDIARRNGVHVVQRRFQGFGDQWNYALRELPIKSRWTMKLDPDERLSGELKSSLRATLAETTDTGLMLNWCLWFMGRPLHVNQRILRLWRTGSCRFSDVIVNEHPIVSGSVGFVKGDLEHHDSPSLHHWVQKQNMYTSAEALISFRGSRLSEEPKLFGNRMQRRMWLKSRLVDMPFRNIAIFLYCFFGKGAWRAGRVGYAWAKLRVFVYYIWALKVMEMRLTGREIAMEKRPSGKPHPDAIQA